MPQFLWICLGGALGTGARYLLSGWVLKMLGPSFPFGTLAVNVIGSFLVAALMVVGTETTLMPPTLRLVLTAGVLGGFTTYSAFSYETLKSFQDGAWQVAALNVFVTVVGCFAACLLGWVCARRLIGA